MECAEKGLGAGGWRPGVRLRIDRPVPYAAVVRWHLPVVVGVGLGLLLARLLPLSGLPVRICTFLLLTGYPCPSCGFTRAFIALAHGRWAAAWHNAPLAVGVGLAAAAAFLVSLAGLALGVRIRLTWNRPVPRAVVVGLVAGAGLLVVLNWGYRLGLGLK